MSWEELRFTVPEEDANALYTFAVDVLGLIQMDEDWCTSKRSKDNATLDFSPVDPPSNRKDDW